PTGDTSGHYLPLPARDSVPEAGNPLIEAATALERADLDAAASAYALAVARYPGSLEARQGLAAALVGCGRLDEAVTAVRAAIELAPGSTDLRNLLGVVLYQTGDAQGSEAAFRAARDLDPGDLQSLLNLVDITRSQQRYGEATGYLGEALRLDAGNPEVLVTLASVSLELGDSGAVDIALRRLEAVAPDHSELPLLRRESLAAAG
ncbi:MAG: tetratricopeptide repeat protein, partial [Anaerolineae bacterium]